MFIYINTYAKSVHTICVSSRASQWITLFFSSSVSSLRSLYSVSRDHVSRHYNAAGRDDSKDNTYQKTGEELNILRESPRVTLRFEELLATALGSRDVTQPVDQSVGGWIQSIAHRHGDFSSVLAVGDRLMNLAHDINYRLDRDGHVAVRNFRGMCETQLDRAIRIARFMRVSWQAYHGRPVKGSFQELCIDTMT